MIFSFFKFLIPKSEKINLYFVLALLVFAILAFANIYLSFKKNNCSEGSDVTNSSFSIFNENNNSKNNFIDLF